MERAAGREASGHPAAQSVRQLEFSIPVCRSSNAGQPAAPHRTPGSHPATVSKGSQEELGVPSPGSTASSLLCPSLRLWVIGKRGLLNSDSIAA